MTIPADYGRDTAVGPDSTSLGSTIWRQYFEDSLLQNQIDVALEGNFDLQIAAQRIRQLQAGVLAAEAPLRPVIQSSFSAGVRRFGLYTMDGAGNATTDILPGKPVPEHLPDLFIGAQAGWEIDLWGKLGNLKQAALARLLASEAGRRLLQTAVVAGVAEIYFTLQSLDERIQILDEYIGLQQNALELVRIQKEAGMANELAVKQFENQLLDLRGMRLDLQRQMVEYENAGNLIAGRYPQPLLRTASFFEFGLPDGPAAGLPAALLENRPDIRAAELELAASKAELNAARALFFPSLNIGAVFGTQAFRPDFLVTKPASMAYTLAGGLMAPLVNRRAIHAEFNRSDALRLEALAAYRRTVVNAYAEVYYRLAFLDNLEQQFDLKKQQISAIEAAVDVSGELFRSGRANYLDVLTAQQHALDTELELVDLRLQQWVESVNLYRALGGGWR